MKKGAPLLSTRWRLPGSTRSGNAAALGPAPLSMAPQPAQANAMKSARANGIIVRLMVIEHRRLGGAAETLLDHVVGSGEQRRRDGEAERFRCLEVDDQLELGRLLHRQSAGLRAFEDAVDIGRGAAEEIGEVRSVGH